ncbi:substrate-binding domain-containing protein [Shewanella sp. AS16]|uniref:substrate-binding domain-containing protein n=1 Tax=Shewanella sp. AS16 TaxID=2907625 RepID=UPI001F3C42E3|nr:substrate-binding domain-containing protein [Shewanella sp. AS16]MCE9685674.1 substrate-binding domain-containing protein [Shewanella sp. AS16]
MKALSLFSLLCLGALFAIPQVLAQETLTLGVIGKTKKDSFYEQSLHGCQAYAKAHTSAELRIDCLYGGPEYFQDIREQAIAINEMIARGVDGLLVSTTDSKYLVEHALVAAKARHIPVITFDSDLLPEHSGYRLAYVGTNNFDLGVALGNYAKQFKTQGQTLVCIQSGNVSTPNLDERIHGVRFALSGEATGQRLDGANGWKEYDRCPFYTSGKRDMALNQLELVLKKSVPVFIAVAGFAQFSPHYITRMTPYRRQISSHETVIISADTEALQLEALEQALSTVNIGQRPFEMGRLGAEMLHHYLTTGQVPPTEFSYLGFHTCTRENTGTCTGVEANDSADTRGVY